MIKVEGNNIEYHFEPEELKRAYMDIEVMMEAARENEADKEGAARVYEALSTARDILIVFIAEHGKKEQKE